MNESPGVPAQETPPPKIPCKTKQSSHVALFNLTHNSDSLPAYVVNLNVSCRSC